MVKSMQDLRKIIAENICALRTESGMTQAQLAEILCYTDKAVSKWERGEAIPDVTVLKEIADHFGVTVDYLLKRAHTEEEKNGLRRARLAARNRLVISLISAVSVWVLATVAFVVMLSLGVVTPPPWMLYVYSIPICAIVVLVFNSIWGRRRLNFVIVSVLLWSILLSLYLSVLLFGGLNLWFIFIIGAPAQVVILFVPGITVLKKDKKSEREES